MRIDRHRIGECQRPQVGRRLRQDCRGCAVGPVHVEPELLLPAEFGKFTQRIDGPGAHAAARAYDEKRQPAVTAIGVHLRPDLFVTARDDRIREPSDEYTVLVEVFHEAPRREGVPDHERHDRMLTFNNLITQVRQSFFKPFCESAEVRQELLPFFAV